MKNIALTLTLIFAFSIASQKSEARTLLTDDKSKHVRAAVHNDDEDDNDSRPKSYYKEADSGLELRKIRRMGVGLQAAGGLGMGGAVLELSFSPQWGFTAGYGGGQGFQATEFEGKYVLAGDWLMPFLNFGFAHWSSTGKSTYIQKTNPGILGDKLLSEDQKVAGEFQENLLYPGLGLQFVQLKGPWAGASVFAEILVLLDVGNFVAAPTGALGLLYYF